MIDSVNRAWIAPVTPTTTLIGVTVGDRDGSHPSDFEETPEQSYIDIARTALARRFPAFANSTMRGGWTGVYMQSPDGHPIIDRLEQYLPFKFIKVHHEPNGTFPNGVPNPMLIENHAAPVEALRKHGIAVATKREGKSAQQGAIGTYIHAGDQIGVLVELNCETDFVARTDDFKAFAKEICMQVIKLAIEIAREGREGKPVGTAFVLGDSDAVLERSRQLILNPLAGHSSTDRKITNPDMRENIKELALLDGAFVIREDGTVEAAGRYISIDTSNVRLSKGFGTRHVSVAAITQETKAIGIVVSESGGQVRIMARGRIILETN